MKSIFKSINSVLVEWNPIDVDKEIAEEEYQKYIPLILKSIYNETQLIICLENILVNELEIGYDQRNEKHLEDIKQVCKNLIEVFKTATEM
jgi:hypothetical protein